MKRLVSAALAIVGIALASCGTEPGECSASASGFGGAPVVKLDLLPTPIVAAGNACRSRLDVLRTQTELEAAYAELGLAGAPAVDFARQVVVVRVSIDAAGVNWSVLDKSGIVVGLRGCTTSTDACSATFYTAPAPVTSIDSRTCDAVPCGFGGGG